MKVENWLEKRNKDIELRSEEVQEVMGQVPAWIVRWGIRLLFLVVVTLLVGSCFFKYPDVITADMTLTGQHPATAVVTRAAGKIQELLVRDNRPVRQGDWLAVIENHADTDDAIYLDKALERSGSDVDSLDKALSRSYRWVICKRLTRDYSRRSMPASITGRSIIIHKKWPPSANR